MLTGLIGYSDHRRLEAIRNVLDLQGGQVIIIAGPVQFISDQGLQVLIRDDLLLVSQDLKLLKQSVNHVLIKFIA